MIKGYFAHMGQFPSVSPTLLFGKRRDYITARKARSKAAAAALLATEAKDNALQLLSRLMKSCLKKSQVDVTNDPQKLALIGWGPKQQLQSAEPPGQPTELNFTTQEKAGIQLKWNPPINGGAVRNYIIKRRQQINDTGRFGPWTVTATALKTESKLTEQPRGIRLEYKVTAINTGGESPPSNTISVVF
jgi:hypothetical protein